MKDFIYPTSRTGTTALFMFKIILINTFILFYITSCASTSDIQRLGTGKPKFASLELEGVSYDLNSEDGYYRPGKPLKLFLKLKNISQTEKTFNIEKNRMLILIINNEFSENLKTVEIPPEGYIIGNNFALAPDEERTFEINLNTTEDFFKINNSVFCQVRLFFLPKQFRRNALSVYVEKK
jgi:hypothetical protein